jgi:hypothetical protein
MPRNRPSHSAISASRTRSAAAPRRRSQYPMMPAPIPGTGPFGDNELDFPDGPHGFLAIRAVEGLALHEDRGPNVVTVRHVREEVRPRVSASAAFHPEMVMRIDDGHRRFQDLMGIVGTVGRPDHRSSSIARVTTASGHQHPTVHFDDLSRHEGRSLLRREVEISAHAFLNRTSAAHRRLADRGLELM